MHAFNRGVKLVSKENYVKAGYKFYAAYYKGYYPGFEALAFAALSYNVGGYPDASRIFVNEAEMNAGLFIDVYASDEYGSSSNVDTDPEMEIEALYDALFTIADTASLWRELELKESLNILVYAAASNFMDTEVYDSAIYYSNIGLKHFADPDLYITKGDSWLGLEQPDSALSAYSAAMELSPDDAYAVCGMGEASQLKKKNAVAMEYFDKALEIEPENNWVLYCKASLLNEMYEYSEAIELFSRIIELNPSYYICYFDRAGIYFDLDDYELAIDDYNKFLEFEPGDEDAIYNINAAEENMWEGY